LNPVKLATEVFAVIALDLSANVPSRDQEPFAVKEVDLAAKDPDVTAAGLAKPALLERMALLVFPDHSREYAVELLARKAPPLEQRRPPLEQRKPPPEQRKLPPEQRKLPLDFKRRL